MPPRVAAARLEQGRGVEAQWPRRARTVQPRRPGDPWLRRRDGPLRRDALAAPGDRADGGAAVGCGRRRTPATGPTFWARKLSYTVISVWRWSAVSRSSLDDRLDDRRPGLVVAVEDAGVHVQRLGRDAQGLGDLLEDLGRRLAQAPLDLAEVGVRHPGGLGQPADRHLGGVALGPDELPQVGPTAVHVDHAAPRYALGDRRCPAGRPGDGSARAACRRWSRRRGSGGRARRPGRRGGRRACGGGRTPDLEVPQALGEAGQVGGRERRAARPARSGRPGRVHVGRDVGGVDQFVLVGGVAPARAGDAGGQGAGQAGHQRLEVGGRLAGGTARSRSACRMSSRPWTRRRWYDTASSTRWHSARSVRSSGRDGW